MGLKQDARRRLERIRSAAAAGMVDVKCSQCERAFYISTDALRDINDAGGKLVCGRKKCQAAALKPSRVEKPQPTKLDMILNVFMQNGRGVLSTWDIVYKVWTNHRREFGLPGYEQEHPNSNRVIMELVKWVGKYIDRVGTNEYRLNDEGWKRWEFVYGEKNATG